MSLFEFFRKKIYVEHTPNRSFSVRYGAGIPKIRYDGAVTLGSRIHRQDLCTSHTFLCLRPQNAKCRLFSSLHDPTPEKVASMILVCFIAP
jgi:hypothetical protein